MLGILTSTPLPEEKVHTTAGNEFGSTNISKEVLIVQALYGLHSSGAARHQQLANALDSMDFKLYLASPSVWCQAASKPDLFMKFDDFPILSRAPRHKLRCIGSVYAFQPTTYLGLALP
jgi:hypothetical protein